MSAPLSLIRGTDGSTILDVLHAATTTWSRFLGLQFRRALPARHGLLIAPCSSIHTMFVRFALDVYFLSAEGTVTEVRRGIRPWRVVVPKNRAHAVLETSANAVQLEAGTAVRINSETQPIPRGLEFLAGDVGLTEDEAC